MEIPRHIFGVEAFLTSGHTKRTVTRNGCCRESLYLKKSLVDITHESLYLLCADKQTHGRERHSSLGCCMNAAPFNRQSLQLDVALPLIR